MKKTPPEGASGGLGGQSASRQEVLVLGAKALEAAAADAVGEAHAESTPRHDPAHERIPAIAAVPRATAQKHLPLAFHRPAVAAASRVPYISGLDSRHDRAASGLRREMSYRVGAEKPFPPPPLGGMGIIEP